MFNIILSSFAKDLISIIIILLLIVPGIIYIIRSKKQGKKCIGCPYSKSCNKNKNKCKN